MAKWPDGANNLGDALFFSFDSLIQCEHRVTSLSVQGGRGEREREEEKEEEGRYTPPQPDHEGLRAGTHAYGLWDLEIRRLSWR